MKKGIGIIAGIFVMLLGVSFVLGAVVINEVVVDPQTDWDGSGSATISDEWIELYNGDLTPFDLTGWNLSLIDGTSEVETLSGIIPAQDYFIILNPEGSQNNDGQIILYDNNGVLIDSVSYGNYDDGNVLDNAPDGNSNNLFDECLARMPNGVDTDVNSNDFIKTSCTKGSSNINSLGDININGLGNYPAIQAAIDAAVAGDVINIGAGSSPYTEDLVIDEAVSLVGAGSGVVTIRGMHTITASDVSITEVTLETTGVAVTIDSSGSIIDGVSIINCIFDLSNFPSVGVYVGGGNPVNKVTNLVMDSNVFNGPTNKVCNPWKIGGSFGLPLSAEVDDIDFTNNHVNSCSIPLNLQDGNLRDILIDNNVFRNTDGIVYVWSESGSGPTGVLSRFVFTNNDVGGTNTYGVGIDLFSELNDGNFGSGNAVNNNDFEGVVGDYGFGAVSNLATGTYKLDAEENWWGACDGPSGAGLGSGSNVSANVDYEPFIGVCISNELYDACAFENQDATISADLVGEGIEDVWFTYTANGVDYNKAGVASGGDQYSYGIPASELVGGDVSFNVFVNDSFGRIYSNSLVTFYVRNNTELMVAPTVADGSNGWFVSEPLFSLLGDGTLNRGYYQWESENDILYTTPFRLENIPNQPNVTAGTLKLSYWSEFTCGNETKNNQTFHIDLTDPLIKDLVPSDGSLVPKARPEITAYLDEVYQSNSGINLVSVNMEVDGEDIPEFIVASGSSDAVVSYTPTVDLTDGIHEVRVYVEDNAGRSSELFWSFEVNSSLSGFDLNVVSPVVMDYDSRRVEFDIRTDKEVELIEYINYNDNRPRWRRLCKNCNEYGVNRARTKNMKEGENNVSFRAVDNLGNLEEVNVLFFIDSKSPRISKVLPRRNSFTNGSDFYVKYTEDNVKEVLFSFNPDYVVSACTESGRNVECSFTYDLSLYDGQEIEYTMSVSDSLRSVESKPVKVTVDMSAPDVLNEEGFWNQGDGRNQRYIYFDMEIDELNLDEVSYIDWTDSKPKWKRLCSRLKDGYCEKRKSFKKGLHNVDVMVLDEAGNSVVVSVGEFGVV